MAGGGVWTGTGWVSGRDEASIAAAKDRGGSGGSGGCAWDGSRARDGSGGRFASTGLSAGPSADSFAQYPACMSWERGGGDGVGDGGGDGDGVHRGPARAEPATPPLRALYEGVSAYPAGTRAQSRPRGYGGSSAAAAGVGVVPVAASAASSAASSSSASPPRQSMSVGHVGHAEWLAVQAGQAPSAKPRGVAVCYSDPGAPRAPLPATPEAEGDNAATAFFAGVGALAVSPIAPQPTRMATAPRAPLPRHQQLQPPQQPPQQQPPGSFPWHSPRPPSIGSSYAHDDPLERVLAAAAARSAATSLPPQGPKAAESAVRAPGLRAVMASKEMVVAPPQPSLVKSLRERRAAMRRFQDEAAVSC